MLDNIVLILVTCSKRDTEVTERKQVGELNGLHDHVMSLSITDISFFGKLSNIHMLKEHVLYSQIYSRHDDQLCYGSVRDELN